MPFISNLAEFSDRKPWFKPTSGNEHNASWMNSQHLCWRYVVQQLTVTGFAGQVALSFWKSKVQKYRTPRILPVQWYLQSKQEQKRHLLSGHRISLITWLTINNLYILSLATTYIQQNFKNRCKPRRVSSQNLHTFHDLQYPRDAL